MKSSLTRICLIFAICTPLLVSFSVADQPDFTLKWMCNTGMDAFIGPVSKDIDGDGIHELFIAGQKHGTTYGRIIAINGLNGDIIWQKNFSGSYIDPHCPCAIGDLDNDGTYEVVHVANDRTIARNCEDGSIFWNVDVPSGWHQFVIVDTDGTGYPYVYVTDHGSAGGSQKVSKLRGTDGEIIAQHSIRYSCYGGVSAADLEGDGEVEIIVTDTNSGRGLQCFDDDLNLIWNHDHVKCESHCGVIADVNNDSILDVIALHQGYNGGIIIVNGSTGEIFPGKNQTNLNLGCHVQPAVYDIDKDGNLELITAYGSDAKVWDLVDWCLDATLNNTHCSAPPDFANVMGDEDLEIIACNGYGDKIFNRNYELIYNLSTSSYESVVQDIDNNSFNEMILISNGSIKTYDTLAGVSSPKVRTDTPYYSERRTGAEVYILPPEIHNKQQLNDTPGFELSFFIVGILSILLKIRKNKKNNECKQNTKHFYNR